MSSITFKVEVNDLKEVKEIASESIERALEQCGALWESQAKMLSPVDTGRLRNSIEHHAENETTMVVETDVEYAVWVEMGHSQEVGRYVPAIEKRLVNSYVPPQPFLKPAGENNVNAYEAKEINIWH